MNILWNSEEKRVRAPWRLFVQGILFVGISVVTMSVAGSAIAQIFGLDMGKGLPVLAMEHIGVRVLVMMMQCAAALVSVWVAVRYLDRRCWSDIGLARLGRWMGEAGLGFLMGGLLMTFIFVVELLAGWVQVGNGSANHMGLSLFWVTVLTLVAMVIGAFAEELVFRGYHLRNIVEGAVGSRVGPRGAVFIALLVSSVFFGALHALSPESSTVAVVNIAFAGLMYGFAFLVTGRLGLVTGLHAAWNFFQSNVYGFTTSGQPSQASFFQHTTQTGPDLWTGGSFGPEAGAVATIATLIGIALLGWRWRYGFRIPSTELEDICTRTSRTS